MRAIIDAISISAAARRQPIDECRSATRVDVYARACAAGDRRRRRERPLSARDAVSALRAALWVFHDVIVPSWLQHRLRTVLTLVGVVIGVQVVVAVALVNRSTIASFEYTAETIAGGADLQIANATAGVPEDLIAAVAAQPSVASAAGLIQSTLRTEWGPLTLFGADLLGDQRIRQTQFPREHVNIPDELRFLNSPDSVAISASFAARAGLSLGSSFQTIGATGHETLTVRGFLDPIGPAALFGGAVALADLPTAQRLCGLGNRVVQIDIKIAEGTPVERVRDDLSALVAGVGTVGPPRDRAAQTGGMLLSLQIVLTLCGLFSIMVGAFIIFHTMQTAIVQRQRDLALCRAVGFSAATVVGAVLVEALVFGAAGAFIGIVLGAVSAQLSLDVVTRGISAIWARVDHATLALSLQDVSLGCMLGVGISLAAVISPSRQLLRMNVIAHLHNQHEYGSSYVDVTSIVIGVTTVLIGAVLPYLDLRPDSFAGKLIYIISSIVLLALGYIRLAPAIIQPALQMLAAVARRLPGVAFALAIERVAVHNIPRRPNATPALMLAFAMVLIVSASIASLRGSLLSWVDRTLLTADFIVLPSSQLPLPASPTLPIGIEETIANIPGVAVVNPTRAANVVVGEALVLLRTDSRGGVRRNAYPVIESDSVDWMYEFDRGDAVLVSDNLAYRHHLHAGDRVWFDTPSGRAGFVIAAVVVDYTLDVGTVIVEHDTYRRMWQDDLVNALAIWITPGADRELVQSEIMSRIPSEIPITIITGAEFKRTMSDALDGALVMTYALQVLAVAIALIGLVNFFFADVEDRRREIGLLRGVALDRSTLLRVLMLEALIVGTFSGVIAVLYAWPVSLIFVTHSSRLMSGLQLAFTFPYELAAVTVVVAGGTAMLAAYYPFRRATAVPIAELVTVE